MVTTPGATSTSFESTTVSTESDTSAVTSTFSVTSGSSVSGGSTLPPTSAAMVGNFGSVYVVLGLSFLPNAVQIISVREAIAVLSTYPMAAIFEYASSSRKRDPQ